MAKFVVIVEDDGAKRVFGTYRSFMSASADARQWHGIHGCSAYVCEIEDPVHSEEPWNPRYNWVTNKETGQDEN